MAMRASGNATALRRLMTEYKQLTAGGPSVCAALSSLFAVLLTHLVSAGSPDGMFTAGGERFFLGPTIYHAVRSWPLLPPGPVSESDFFTWEALICGPKDTPFVKSNLFISLPFPFVEMITPPPSHISLRKAVFLRPS
jgi:ubiquitin-conjugating enzyme E2 G2